jgi:alpha-D-ribose 1-methylphosphonate 5-triphosphate synthase subunit PhnL
VSKEFEPVAEQGLDKIYNPRKTVFTREETIKFAAQLSKIAVRVALSDEITDPVNENSWLLRETAWERIARLMADRIKETQK